MEGAPTHPLEERHNHISSTSNAERLSLSFPTIFQSNPSSNNNNTKDTDDDDDDDLEKANFSSPPPPVDTLTLRIQESRMHPTSSAATKMTVTVSPYDTVATLKRAVVATVQRNDPTYFSSNNNKMVEDSSGPPPPFPYVRLIAAGRLLAPDLATLQQFALYSDQVIHAVIVQNTHVGAQAAWQHASTTTTAATSSNDDAGHGQPAAARALRATGVNAEGWAVRRDPNEDDDDDDDVMFHREEEEEDEDEGLFVLDGGVPIHSTSDAGVIDLESGRPTRVRRTGTQGSHHHGRLPLGFDRLRVTAGLSRAEITVLRAYFGTNLDRWLVQHPAVNQLLHQQEPVDTLRRRRLLEEAWMEAQGPASEFRLNLNLHTPTAQQLRWTASADATTSPQEAATLYRNSVTGSSVIVGTDRDFCWGFMLGFFVGFFMLLWVWMPTVPHKQKLGILTGYSFHLALGMFNKHDDVYVDDVVLLGD